ncbi:CHAT domain-containing protein [Crepidotus variabilis]|uniref:CHAT domain-containing protein n=1 Tax=Crepidotus variabilis TaxID=179855 RepID=A0A9P6EQ53_9AGAR|nr:CHAT domain-containing protein [Crepidotus variabilis]
METSITSFSHPEIAGSGNRLPVPPNASLVAMIAVGIVLRDITLECSQQDAQYHAFDFLQMTVTIVDAIGEKREPRPLVWLERTSKTSWKYHDSIEWNPNISEVALVVRSEKTGDFGHLTLTKETVKAASQDDSSKYQVIQYKMDITTSDTPLIWVKFTVSTANSSSSHHNPENVCLDANLGKHYHSLGETSRRRFYQTKNLADLNDAIENLQKAIETVPKGDPDTIAILGTLGISLLARFQLRGDLADISQAIEHQLHAVRLTSEDHPGLLDRLTILAMSFKHRFEQTNNLSDVLSAIDHQRKAIGLIPQAHPNLPLELEKLGSFFWSCFQRTRSISDISEAIEYQQKAVEITSGDHPDLARRLHILSTLFKQRFDAHPRYLSDVSYAIEHQQRAVLLTSEGNPTLPSQLEVLGNLFWTRFQQTGDLPNLFDALKQHQQIILLTPEGHPDLPRRLNNIGSTFAFLFQRTSDITYISSAIEHQEKAILLAPEDHVSLPFWLNSLGSSFTHRSTQTRDLADVSSAVKYQQRACSLTPEGHPILPSYLNNLGTSLRVRFEYTGDLDDLSDAIEHQKVMVSRLPEGHFHSASQLHNLGNYLFRRFEQTSDVADCREAITNYHLATRQTASHFSDRLTAAKSWVDCSRKLQDHAETLEAYGHIIGLLSEFASLDRTIQNRYTNLVDVSKNTAEAVAFALTTGSANAALEWLEQGRCIVWTQLNLLRTPVDTLRLHDKQLANQFLTVSKALEASGSRPDPFGKSVVDKKNVDHDLITDQVHAHAKLAQEREELLAQIRNIPEFTDFLRPLKAPSILSQLPEDGPVIIINVHPERCEALALLYGADEPLHIPLNNFSYVQAEVLRRELRGHLASEGLRMRSDRAGRVRPKSKISFLRQTLRELWIGVVQPILESLGYSSPPAHRKRIWWCPTGPLVFLPIHAAGILSTKTTKAGPCLSDFVVSSYIPTITTLLEKISNAGKLNLEQPKNNLFLLSQPNALPHFPISGTTTETQTVLKRMEDPDIGAVLLEGEDGTLDKVTEQMKSHGWIHFATHASQNTNEPLQSGFYIQGGQLTVDEIIRQQLVSTEFAYLSACETSVGDEKLSEEVVHLAAGMLAAGYQGVVATMWAIKDHYAPVIAEDFYGYLLQAKHDRGARRLDSRIAAYALDDAIQRLKAKLGDDEAALLIWVPYIHLGL